MKDALKNALADLRACGPHFAWAGLRSRRSRAPLETLALSSGERIAFRPRQSDFPALRQVFRNLEYRLPADVAVRVGRECQRMLAAGSVPVIVDAGANIGAASVWFKAQFPEAAVVAIEPDPENAALARRNVSGLPGASVLEAAVGGEPGFVAVLQAEHAWAVKTERADAGCAIVTIDQAVATVPSGKLLIAKIDIEGFESDLFAGDLRWLDDVHVIYLEPHDWMLPGRASSRSFQAALGQRDFDIHLSGENLIYVRRGTAA